MNRVEIHRPDQGIQAIGKKCFGYNGRTYAISTDIPTTIHTYWDGGSRDSYAFYNLSTGEVKSVPSNHPLFDKGVPSKVGVLPVGFALVKNTIFCGKNLGVTIYVNPENLTKMVEVKKEELTWQERVVLVATRSLKNTYGGESNIRFKESHRYTGITSEEWNTAQKSLIARKMLNKNGAINANGRNAIGEERLHSFKK